MKISIQTRLIAALLVFCSTFVHAQDCVVLYFDSNQDGDDLVVRLKVDNFDNILISQFAFSYSYANLELKEVQGNVDIGLDDTHVFSEVPGYISVSWSNASVGQTLANGSALIEMRFTELAPGVSEFRVDPNFTNSEFYNAFLKKFVFRRLPIRLMKTEHSLSANCTMI